MTMQQLREWAEAQMPGLRTIVDRDTTCDDRYWLTIAWEDERRSSPLYRQELTGEVSGLMLTWAESDVAWFRELDRRRSLEQQPPERIMNSVWVICASGALLLAAALIGVWLIFAAVFHLIQEAL